MKTRFPLLAALALLASSRATAFDPGATGGPPPDVEIDAQLKVPLFSEKFAEFPVATAGDEVITLDELGRAISEAHAARKEGQAGGKDFMPILERLIDARLLVAEARAMGIDELPEVAKALEAFDRETLRTTLQATVIGDTKPDALEVERVYRDATREWKIRSAFFNKPEHGLEFKTAVLGGGDFAALAHQAVKDGKATYDEGKGYVRTANLLPAVAAMIAGLAPGAISEPIKLPTGVTVVKVDDIRYADDPAAKADAEAQSLARQNREKLQAYYDGLVKKYAKIDKALLASVNFEGTKPGIKGYMKDQRVLVRVKGAKPITVGELATLMEKQFYHGVDRAARDKKVNLQKGLLLDAILSDRIVPLEARAKGLDKTPEYQRRRAEAEANQLFKLFLQRVIVPQVKLDEEELKAHYEAHRKDYTFPSFYRLETLGFEQVKDAQRALEKLQAGTDIKWLKQNAAGQVPEEKLTFTGGVVAGTAMPDDVKPAFAGVKAGDFRLFTHEGQSFVARVADVTPEEVRPYEEVREDIQKAVFYEKLGKAIKGHADEIRKVRPVKVYLTRIG